MQTQVAYQLSTFDAEHPVPNSVELLFSFELKNVDGVVGCVPVPVARGLRRRSATARLLRSWVRIPPEAWIFVCCECCVLSRRGVCDELITRPEESYRLCCVVVCDLETSRIGAPYIYI